MFTIGSDVEVFGIDKNGQHVALCGKIGGTKEEPLQVADMPTGFMVQEDNVSLEFNIPVCTTGYEFVEAIGIMTERVKKILKDMGLSVSHAASVSFAQGELTHPNALVFGCEPDYNAWTRRENDKPTADDKCLRTAGGHVHVGVDEVDMLDGIRAMDLYLGVPSVLLDNSPEAQRRRLLYGKPGAMRPKPYGFEYRVLSNFWIFNPQYVEWVFNNTSAAMEFVRCNKKDACFTKEESTRIQNCISSGDENEAKAIIEKFAIPMPGQAVVVAPQAKTRQVPVPPPQAIHIIDPWANTHGGTFNITAGVINWHNLQAATAAFMDDTPHAPILDDTDA